jgi:hypothetical protein
MDYPDRLDELPREWALCAIAAAATRFIPIPLLDDLVKETAVRTGVNRTWQAHGRVPIPRITSILASDSSGFGAWLREKLIRLPIVLLFYPIRKFVRIVTAAHGVSKDLAETMMLLRCVDRCLRAGWFVDPDPAVAHRQAKLVRFAFEQTMAGADLKLLQHSYQLILDQSRDLRLQATSFARRTFRPAIGAGEGFEPALDTSLEPQLESSAEQLGAVSERPDLKAFLSDLDARFDRHLEPPPA